MKKLALMASANDCNDDGENNFVIETIISTKWEQGSLQRKYENVPY